MSNPICYVPVQNVIDWYNSSNLVYSEERLVKIRHWIEDNSSAINLVSSNKTTSYTTNECFIGWATS